MTNDGSRALTSIGELEAQTLSAAIGRRSVLRAAAALAAAGVVGPAVLSGRADATASTANVSDQRFKVLQPGLGKTRGTYLRATPQTVTWGELPNRSSTPAAVVQSGGILTLDGVSHEGVLEDQGKDPIAYFGSKGVPRGQVLDDAIDIAANKAHTGPGPHVVTGPVAVVGAEVGDVLKVETLDLALRVPYGVISNRHGKGALPGEYPEQFEGVLEDQPFFNQGGNISVFAQVQRKGGTQRGVLPGRVPVSYPLSPFMGLIGVARDTSVMVDSVPPTDAGGNLDINALVVGSALYLPVHVPGAMFFSGDPHMAQGDGEVALTAMEGSLRATFRLTVIKPGGRAPSVAFDYPFAETSEHWIPIGLSDPDGPEGGAQVKTLDEAMKTAVRNALAFLTRDMGMEGAIAYAYLSAAADFVVSQVVDRTTGIHGLIRKADFDDH
jgi:acetamidase/formamidase